MWAVLVNAMANISAASIEDEEAAASSLYTVFKIL